MEAAETNGAIEHLPESIIDRLEPDVLLAQDVADADPLTVPADATVAADPPDLEVAGIFDRGEPVRIRSVRRMVDGCGRLLSQRLVRPLVVEEMTEGVESFLLDHVVLRRRSGGLGLEGPMHSLVACVLLRMRRLDELGEDPQADPPDRELGEPSDGGGGKGSSVVGADDPGKSVFLEEPHEDGLGEVVGGRQKRLNVEQVPGRPGRSTDSSRGHRRS